MQAVHKLVLLVALTILGCEVKKETSVNNVPITDKPQFRPSASIQQIMLAIIDENVDPIWNSISTISTASGVIEKRPQRDDEWAQLEKHAIALREATNLLLIEGRKVADEGSKTSIHHSELNAVDIEKSIAANRHLFNQLVLQLEDASAVALTAIRAKNVDALEAAGEQIEKSCEACHSQFWYPGDKRPTQ
ncbi:MAG TPA: hypothetical protein VIZ65_14085 [Cellvibrionaceae bacterium]